MSRITKNEGLMQSGGKISANQIAVGRNARTESVRSVLNNANETDTLREIHERISELIQAVKAHSSSLPNYDDLINSTQLISQELSKKKPNKLTVTTVLDGIAKSVTSVTAVAKIVEALKSVVLRVF